MHIRLLRFFSVAIRISLQELHVLDTCFYMNLHIMERYVITTYRLHEFHMCIQSGYVTTTYPKYKLKRYMSVNGIMGLIFL